MLLSMLAIGNAAITYKKSTYFETTTRVDLQEIIAHADELEKSRLVELTQRLAAISDSDYQVLNILSNEFRRAIVFLIVCLVMGVCFIVFLMLRPYFKIG